jgi:hypothetical protein
LAFQASVTSPQALSARILWGLKNLPKISVFFSQNYQMIQKALQLHTVGLKSYFFSQNYQMIQKALELHTVGLKSYFFSQNYQMIQKALELHTVGLKSFLGAKNVEKFRPNLVHFCYRF